MANSYLTTLTAVTTTGSDVTVFTSRADTIVRDVQIYAKGGAATVSVKYDDGTTDDVIAKKLLIADETWRPFAAPLATPDTHELKVNTSVAVNVLITYVEFS